MPTLKLSKLVQCMLFVDTYHLSILVQCVWFLDTFFLRMKGTSVLLRWLISLPSESTNLVYLKAPDLLGCVVANNQNVGI
jgi:hypothetical protein